MNEARKRSQTAQGIVKQWVVDDRVSLSATAYSGLVTRIEEALSKSRAEAITEISDIVAAMKENS